MDFLKEVIKKAGGEYATLASEIKETQEWVDTGSYTLNALLSGSIFGGMAKNKITALAAPESCGKTYIALSIVSNFLKSDPNSMCVYFDTESAITKAMLLEKNIDVSRVVIINIATIEEFSIKANQIVDIYKHKPEEERKPFIMVLDSLGMLSTNHEIATTLDGKDTRDMSKAQKTKGAFRTLTLALGKQGIPLLTTNHLYDTMSLYSSKEMSSGSGLKYSASTVLYISKSKEKDGSEIVGVVFKFKAVKSRLSRENREAEVRLFYDKRGLDRYYGLLDLAVEGKIIERIGNKYQFGEIKFYRAELEREPEKYFTQELLEKIDEYAKEKFSYGSTLGEEEEEELDGKE